MTYVKQKKNAVRARESFIYSCIH